jgi:hypothetical protein
MPPKKTNVKFKGLEAPNPNNKMYEADEYTSSEEEVEETVEPVKETKNDKYDRRLICEKARQAKLMKNERLKKEKELKMEEEIEKRLNERIKGLSIAPPSAPPAPLPKQKQPKKRIIEEKYVSDSSSSEEENKQYYPSYNKYYNHQNIQKRGPSPLLQM